MLYIAAACKWLCSGHGLHARCGWRPWHFSRFPSSMGLLCNVVSKSRRDPQALCLFPSCFHYLSLSFVCSDLIQDAWRILKMRQDPCRNDVIDHGALRKQRWESRPVQNQNSKSSTRRPGHVDVLFRNSTQHNSTFISACLFLFCL